jgi:hypothetical protein
MLKVQFIRDHNGHREAVNNAVFARSLDDVPHFMSEGAIVESEDVGDDYLPFTLAYTVDKLGYALVPTHTDFQQDGGIRITRLEV